MKKKYEKFYKKQKEEIINNSIDDIKHHEGKFLAEETIKEIVDKNFKDFYQDTINDYNDYLNIKKKQKHDYHIQLSKCCIPLLLSATITLATIGGYAIYYRNNLDTFTQNYATVTTYNWKEFDSSSLTWEESTQDFGGIPYVKITKLIDNKGGIKTFYYKVSNKEAKKIAEDIKNHITIDEIETKYNLSSSTSVVEFDKGVEKPYIQVDIIEEEKKVTTYKEKQENTQEPLYKKLSIAAAVLNAIGGGVSTGLYFHFNVNEDTKKYKESKKKLKKAKQKIKMIK